MKVAAIICEFNPFHKGHKYLIDEARHHGATHIVAIMSPNFVQRGDCAVLNKFIRAEIAINNGVDLVVELPTPWAVSSAEKFADAGVQIADMLRADELWFGSESGDVKAILSASNAINDIRVQNMTANHLKNGCTYASAITNAVESVYGKATSILLQSPNNILAIEYARSAINRKSNIKLCTVKRKNVGHDINNFEDGFTSGSNLRSMMFASDDNFFSFSEKKDAELIKKEIDKGFAPAKIGNGERAIVAKLRCMKKEDFALLPDVTEGLENRIFDAIKENNQLDAIINSVKCKRYTHARIRRIIICAFLGISANLQSKDIPYVRALMFNQNGAELLPSISKSNNAVISVAKSICKDSSPVSDLLRFEIKCSDLWGILTPKICPTKSDYKNFCKL